MLSSHSQSLINRVFIEFQYLIHSLEGDVWQQPGKIVDFS